MTIDADSARREILDPGIGFVVVRGLYSPQQIDTYRDSCERFIESGTRIRQRILTSRIKDYVHPRSHDREERTVRIYQYFHNHHGDETGSFLDRAIALRDRIEQGWLDDPGYSKERQSLFDYVIVTHYNGNKGLLPKHVDYDGPAPKPLVQFWVALSEPGKDYRGGNLILYSKDGSARRVETDLEIRKGDALIFDKSLPHEVELTETPPGALGRWTVLIGARAHCDTPLEAFKKRVIYGPPLFPLIAWGSRVFSGMR